MAYQGEVVLLPLGETGLTGSASLSKVLPTALLTATNISYDQDTIRKEGGATAYNSVAAGTGGPILGGWDWWPTPGVQRSVIYTSAGLLLKDDGAGSYSTSLATGLATSGTPVFCEAGREALANNRKLFVCNGSSPVRVLSGDGSTATTISLPPADWSGTHQPISLANHDGRLWGAVDHRVYYSTPGNHEDFQNVTDAGSLAVGAGHGEKIVQIMSYKGLLLVWKFPVGVFYVDTTNPNVANWSIRRLSTVIGGVSPLGAVQIADDILFLDAAGNFQLLSGIQEFGNIGLKNLTQLNLFGPFMREHVNLAYLYKVQSVFYPHKLEAHFTVAQINQTTNNARIVIDFNKVGQARFRWSDRDTCEAIWMRRDSDTILRPLIGDGVGFVWKLDQDVYHKGSSGYASAFQTPHLDFGWLSSELATKRKLGQFLEIVCEASGNWEFDCDVYWDNTLSQTIHFVVTPSGAELGSFILGTSTLGASSTIALRKRVSGSGKRVSFKFYNSTIDTTFNIAQAYFSFVLGDERTN